MNLEFSSSTVPITDVFDSTGGRFAPASATARDVTRKYSSAASAGINLMALSNKFGSMG